MNKGRIIDIDTWEGKKHYLWFKEYPVHYYSIYKTIDITKFYQYIKTHTLTFFIPLVYLVNRALNEIREFRLRKIGENVIEYDVIHPAYTIMTEEGIFDNCEHEYHQDFEVFYSDGLKAISEAKIGVQDKPYNDATRFDQFYFTSLPWIDFLGGTHPMPHNDNDYIPRIVWSKYSNNNGIISLTMGIQVSHALVDGYPLALGFINIQEFLNNPEKYLE